MPRFFFNFLIINQCRNRFSGLRKLCPILGKVLYEFCTRTKILIEIANTW